MILRAMGFTVAIYLAIQASWLRSDLLPSAATREQHATLVTGTGIMLLVAAIIFMIALSSTLEALVKGRHDRQP